jgi:cytochrome c oxidase subunit 1
VLNVMSTLGASVLGLGYLLIMIYLIASMFKPRNASANPWGATGLEWSIPSPPITLNFETDPIVTENAYDYVSRGKQQSGEV